LEQHSIKNLYDAQNNTWHFAFNSLSHYTLKLSVTLNVKSLKDEEREEIEHSQSIEQQKLFCINNSMGVNFKG